MPGTRLLRGAALIVALALVPAGCSGANTHVEAGEVYATGNADYDAFFKEVVETRELAHKGEAQQGEARDPLLKALGLKEKTDVEKTIEAAQDRAKRMHESGVSLHLMLTPEPKLLAVQGATPLGNDAQELIKAVEDSARTSIDLSKKLGGLPDKCAELEKKRADLRARTGDAFKAEKPIKRREIERELDAAGDVLADASTTSTRNAGIASKFVLDLARAMETGGAAAALAEATSKAKADSSASASAKPVPRWKGPPRGAPVPPRGPAAAATDKPAPPPRPTKPASGGDDFEP